MTKWYPSYGGLAFSFILKFLSKAAARYVTEAFSTTCAVRSERMVVGFTSVVEVQTREGPWGVATDQSPSSIFVFAFLSVVARDQEATIAALKASNCELLAQNESLKNVNLKDHVSSHSEGASIDSSPPGITRLRAQLDVDLSGISIRSNGSGNYATATATVPLKFDSQYRSAMERGM